MKIKINEKDNIDLPKLIAGKLLVQANSGGGKSWLIRRLVEQAYGKVQIIILDPEGEFSTLREKFDFVLAGKGGDTPADPKSAALLARKLLELEVSAIVDLYELHPQERKHFVRLFLESMVNAPKELYHDVIVVLDEAHMFAPEKDQSEALGSVIDMASRGRKRGYSLVLATQRISKLHKDAAAECNNKLIGRTSLDIDRKRAADELGITNKEEVLALRSLQPGEFFAFGPAISDEVKKVKVGEVQTSVPKAGSHFKVAPPTEAIKKILGKLADLPQEAKKEADTIQSMKAEIRSLESTISSLSKSGVGTPMGVSQWRDYGKKFQYWDYFEKQIMQKAGLEWEKLAKDLLGHYNGIYFGLKSLFEKVKMPTDLPTVPKGWMTPSNIQTVKLPSDFKKITATNPPMQILGFGVRAVEDKGKRWTMRTEKSITVSDPDAKLGKGETIVLTAVAQHGTEGITRTHLTTLTGYKRSTRDTFLYRLSTQGLISQMGDRFLISQSGADKLGDYEPMPSGSNLRDHYLSTLPEGERKVLGVLVEAHEVNVDGLISREEISEKTGYARSSRDTYISRLTSRELAIAEKSGIRASDKLFD